MSETKGSYENVRTLGVEVEDMWPLPEKLENGSSESWLASIWTKMRGTTDMSPVAIDLVGGTIDETRERAGRFFTINKQSIRELTYMATFIAVGVLALPRAVRATKQALDRGE